MNKTKKITQNQLAEMVANITKQVIKESILSDQPYDGNDFDSRLTDDQSMSMGTDSVTGNDDEFYDDFLSNPAAEAFPDDNENNGLSDDEIDIDTLLENEENKELVEKQDKLLSFITENWDHHANNLIK